jgi:hypothetical protein
MPIPSSPRALLGGLLSLVAAVAALSCAAASPVVPADLLLPLGTYGGDGGGMIVGDTALHLHIGCTFGDVSGRVPMDANGRFDVAGSYMLRAYPLSVGPAVPARFTGTIDGDRVVVSVTVDDTIAHQTVVKGPVSLRLGVEANLGPCPICRRPVRTRGFPAFRRLALTAATARARPPTR